MGSRACSHVAMCPGSGCRHGAVVQAFLLVFWHQEEDLEGLPLG